jgi:hypothetical protein
VLIVQGKHVSYDGKFWILQITEKLIYLISGHISFRSIDYYLRDVFYDSMGRGTRIFNVTTMSLMNFRRTLYEIKTLHTQINQPQNNQVRSN